MRIDRAAHIAAIRRLLKRAPAVAILGARQVGKTDLAHAVAASFKSSAYFDLERREDATLLENPELALGSRRGLVVLDEVQANPDVFRALRPLVDRAHTPARFLLLGSASPTLVSATAETLAGRIAFYELDGFDLEEVLDRERLWVRGAFPRSYLARTEVESVEWRRDFVRTFLERDVPRLGIGIATRALDRFWAMLAHVHGGIFNASELGRSLGVSHTTVRHYLDVLLGTFVVRELRPFATNLGKRLVKSPKLFVADSGLLHSLLGIESMRDLERHPKLGASWEGFIVTQVVRRLRVQWDECFFWATHAGAELDLLVVKGRHRIGFEVKRTDAPKLTPSMRAALEDLKLDGLNVIHAGTRSFPIGPRVRAIAFGDLLRELRPL